MQELQGLGHHVQILYANRREILQAVCGVVLHEEMIRLMREERTMDREEQVTFIQRWKKENELFLTDKFGMADSTHQYQFIKEVLFVPSSCTNVVPLLHNVTQADGAHSQFGKYILYSAYGTNANGQMSAIGFGLLFGNEDERNWKTFWTFIKTLHVSLDAPIMTFLMDQDESSACAFNEIFEDAAQFMYSFHHRQNILKRCGGKGKIPHSALWVYNILSSCHLVD